MHKLTVKDIKRLQTAKDYGKFGDGGNLYLQGSEEYGTWSWLLRFKSPELGKERWMGLGSLDTFSLAEAREEARKHRQALARGVDPIEQRMRERKEVRDNVLRGITFRDAAEQYMAQRLPQLRSEKHKQQWRDSVHGLYREIGSYPALEVDNAAINAALASVASRAPETARRTAQRAQTVIKWVRAGRPPLVKVERAHHAAMPVEEMPRFMVGLRCKEGITAKALEFCILTVTRTGEVIGARWDEISDGLWTIPANRTKANREHIVPLSKPALELLAKLPRVKGCPYLFPGRGRAHVNSRGMIELLQNMDGCADYTVHGFRSTFSDWARDHTTRARDVVEAALAHAVKDKTEAAYRRGTAVKKRAALMADWAAFCAASPARTGNVVALHG